MPEIKFQDGSTLRDMTALKFQDGATLRTINEAWFQDGATLRKVWPPVVYVPMTVTSQPADATTGLYSPAPRPGDIPFSMSRSMTTANGTVGSIVYSIVNLSGDIGDISVSVSGDGTHTASISGSGTRNRFDDDTNSVTFRVKATDGTSTVYSRYVTFTDLGAF